MTPCAHTPSFDGLRLFATGLVSRHGSHETSAHRVSRSVSGVSEGRRCAHGCARSSDRDAVREDPFVSRRLLVLPSCTLQTATIIDDPPEAPGPVALRVPSQSRRSRLVPQSCARLSPCVGLAPVSSACPCSSPSVSPAVCTRYGRLAPLCNGAVSACLPSPTCARPSTLTRSDALEGETEWSKSGQHTRVATSLTG